eukprot:4757133-Lingulodinium_polyedra.AAC.1
MAAGSAVGARWRSRRLSRGRAPRATPRGRWRPCVGRPESCAADAPRGRAPLLLFTAPVALGAAGGCRGHVVFVEERVAAGAGPERADP